MSKAKKRVRLKHGTRDYAKPASAVSLARWDHGAMGQANRIGLVTEERGDIDPETGKIINPNSVKGVRRVDMLKVYYDRGWISKRGFTAGEKLRDAWEGTQRSRGVDLSAVRVDVTSKPDATIDIQIDRVSALVRISRLVPHDDQEIISAVVYEGCAIAHFRRYRGRNHDAGKAHLYAALERLADATGG